MAEQQNGRGALVARGLVAILASTCCLGPLVLVALGVSGAWIGNLTVLEPYRPIYCGRGLSVVGQIVKLRRYCNVVCHAGGR